MSEGARYNVIRPPSDDIETVATVINATDDLVYNCLVDNGRIDQKALTESKEQGESSLLITNGNRYSIRGNNIRTVYFLPQGDYWQLTKGQLSLTSQDRRLRQVIGVDKTAAIREAERELQQLEEENGQICREFDQLKTERRQYKVEWNGLIKKENSDNSRISRLRELLETIREEAEAAENVTYDTSELEDEVKRADEVHDELKAREEEEQNALNELNPGIDEIRNKLEEVNARNQKVSRDLADAEQRLQRYLQGLAEKARSLQKRQEKLQSAEQKRQEHSKLVEEKDTIVKDTLYKARLLTQTAMKARNNDKRKSLMQSGEGDDDGDVQGEEDDMGQFEDLESIEPIEANKEPEQYEGKIRRYQREIERERGRRRLTESDPEVALEKYQRAKRNLDSKVEQIDQITNHVDNLVEDLQSRKERWKEFRTHISIMTNSNFDEILNRKGSSGAIKFSHKKKALDLIVQKDNQDEMSQTADVKALSGGERSYTTLALLLALGESLETPFRVMDEFDVFLDPVARRIALQTMIEVAKEFEHRQFIFITPQDLSNIKTDPKLKIFHMKPPKRSDIVGGPTQQTLD